MPSYTFNWTNNTLKTAFTVNDLAVNTITTDLKLFGRGARSYGEGMQENMLRLLENFASDVPPQTPTVGQLWYNVATGTYSKGLKVFDGSGWMSVTALDLADLQSQLDAKVNRTGDAMSGYLTLNDDPQLNYHATTKHYCDLNASAKVSKAGDTMTNFLTLHADPVIGLHAATKAYVDLAIFQAFQNLIGMSEPTVGSFLRNEQYATSGQTVFTGIPAYTIGDNSLWGVYINGIRQPLSSYTETSTTSVTFPSALDANDEVLFDSFVFVTDPGNGVETVVRSEVTATSGQKLVTVPLYVPGSNLMMVWVNGVKQIKGVSYNETNTSQITFTEGLQAGSKIETCNITLITTGAGTIGLNYQHYTATSAGQTSFSLDPPYYHTSNSSDPNNQHAIVFVNGVMQGPNKCVEVNGTSILLSGGLDVGDHVEFYIFDLTP